MAEGFQVSLVCFEASATGVWGMIGVTVFTIVMVLVFTSRSAFRRWLERKLK